MSLGESSTPDGPYGPPVGDDGVGSDEAGEEGGHGGEATAGNLEILGHFLDTDGTTSGLQGGQGRCARADEWIEHDTTRRADIADPVIADSYRGRGTMPVRATIPAATRAGHQQVVRRRAASSHDASREPSAIIPRPLADTALSRRGLLDPEMTSGPILAIRG